MLAGSALPALAHAEFLRSSPEPNAVLVTAPAFIEIDFSEALEQTYSKISVYDTAGAPVDGGDSRVDSTNPARLTVSLRSLPEGVYTVVWQVLSAVDGHVTSGAFAFAVGQAAAEAIPASLPDSMALPAHVHTDALFRWMVFLSIAALFGGNVFVLLVWEPARRVSGFEELPSPPWAEWAGLALAVFFTGSMFSLLVQAGKLADADLVAPWSPEVGQVLFTTRYGSIWLARIALGLCLVAVVRGGGRRQHIVGAAFAGAMLVTLTLVSHAAADSPPTFPLLFDILHLTAASAWVGGLLHFAATLATLRNLPAPQKTLLTANLIPRFSDVALVSVGTLVASGVVASLSRVGSWEGLFGTLYGRTLLFKLTVAAPMLLLGANNLLRVTPRMREAARRGGDESLVERFRGYVTTESYLGVAVFLSVALLTAIPPARTISRPIGIVERARSDDLALILEVSPARVGVNTFLLTLTSGGQPVPSAREVSLRFDPLDGRLPQSELPLEEVGAGQYTAQGANLSLATKWRVRAAVRREGRFDSFADFALDLGATGRRSSWTLVSGLALVVAAAAYLLAQRRLAPSRPAFFGYGVVPALVLALAGVSVAARTPPVDPSGRINPVLPSAESIARGASLYQAQCAACHGPTGKGDGPVGLTLLPPPADLSQHAVPGVHSDGQLFEWISHGYPGSVMPGFADRLEEGERWDIVNFLRTLAPR